MILSFSGGEPTLNKNLLHYIRLAKSIGVGIIEVQTNGTNLFKNKTLVNDLIDAGLDEIFLAQHSGDEIINKELGVFYRISDFVEWVQYVKKHQLHKKVSIYLNIVVTKINLFQVYSYIQMLIDIGFTDLIPKRGHSEMINTHKISFGFCQPNGYAKINKNLVLLDFNENQINEIHRIVQLCKHNNILPDFHFTSPPLCILDYSEYNLEYERLKKLENDEKNHRVNEGNLEAYKWLWKEKIKFDGCKKCCHNNYCLGFYKNWVEFVGEKYTKEMMEKFLNKENH
ncbi:MAG: hypothetical protein PHQ95_04095 [Candidatus Gracilibacteria bacterium]|nr:hypothetical protein [Candidatus Gracilibacteria bacterium]